MIEPRLYAIEPRGIGTLDIEAFGSYLLRLSIAHTVSVNRLLNDVYNTYLLELPHMQWFLEYYQRTNSPKKKKLENPEFRTFGSLATLVRPNSTNANLVDVMKLATGISNLRSTTFLALKNSTSRNYRMFSQHFRWCPTCMWEFEQSSDPGYFKLIWHLNLVIHCPNHGAKLIDKCAKCGKQQKGYGKKIACVRCQHCGKSLANGFSMNDRCNSWEIEGTDLLHLVQEIAQNPEIEYPANGAEIVMAALGKEQQKINQERSFTNALPRDLYDLYRRGHIVSLESARRLAFSLGLSLPDLLAGRIALTNQILDPELVLRVPEEMRPKKRPRVHDRDKIYAQIMRILDISGNDHAFSLEVIAKKVGVSTGYIQHHFSKLAEKIVIAHYEAQKNRQKEMKNKVRSLAYQFFSASAYRNKGYSRKRAHKEIRHKTGYAKHLIRAEVNEVYRELKEEEKRLDPYFGN